MKIQDVVTAFQSPAILSFCSGTLGIERGIERVIGKVRTVAYVEIEAFLCENLVQQMEKGVLDTAPVFTNLKTFDARRFRNKIHGITAGYPCQPFSNAGERKGEEDPRHLFPYLLNIVNTVRPVWCFFENVPGHITLGYEQVYRSLRDIGYAVENGIFSAAEAGATHERERLFILAIRMEDTTIIRQQWSQFEKNIKRRIDSISVAGASDVANSESSGIERLSECEPRQEWSEPGQSGHAERQREEMDHPSSNRPEQDNTIPTRGNSIEFTDKTMEHPTIQGSQERRSGDFGELQAQTKTGIYDRPEQCGDGMANTDKQFIQGIRTEGEQIVGEQQGEVLSGCMGEGIWPAPPGEYQHEWEAPRVIPSLGCTINGHNFREDLLRALGNGVVEQTAEIAFETLANKMLIK